MVRTADYAFYNTIFEHCVQLLVKVLQVHILAEAVKWPEKLPSKHWHDLSNANALQIYQTLRSATDLKARDLVCVGTCLTQHYKFGDDSDASGAWEEKHTGSCLADTIGTPAVLAIIGLAVCASTHSERLLIGG